MVTIDVPIYPDHAASIRAGLDPAAASIAVELDAITPEERDLLADHGGVPVTVTTPTVDDPDAPGQWPDPAAMPARNR
jgi:hypothetical protein